MNNSYIFFFFKEENKSITFLYEDHSDLPSVWCPISFPLFNLMMTAMQIFLEWFDIIYAL